MNPLAELFSAGVPASVPASGGGPTGNAPAPAQNPFADVLGTAGDVLARPAEHGPAVTERAASNPELTVAEEQLQGAVGGENGEAADALVATLLALPAAGSPPAMPGAGPLPHGAGSAIGLADGSVNGKPLPPAMPHSGNPLPPQTGSDQNTGSRGDLRAGLLAALHPDGTHDLAASAGAGIPRESNAAQRLPAGLERLAEAGNLLRNLAGAENLPDGAVTVRPGVLPPLEGAAAVFDPRAMLEANARQHRSASAQAAALESIDRTAPGLESAEPASRPLVARSVTPTLLARDMSALAERVETLAQRPGGVANMSVSLGDLGNVDISVRMEARQAHIQFVVQDAMAREALESQLPRLRAMLEESGLKLGDVNTGLPGKSERDADGERPSGQTDAATTVLDDREAPVDDRPVHGASDSSSHLLDAFA